MHYCCKYSCIVKTVQDGRVAEQPAVNEGIGRIVAQLSPLCVSYNICEQDGRKKNLLLEERK